MKKTTTLILLLVAFLSNAQTTLLNKLERGSNGQIIMALPQSPLNGIATWTTLPTPTITATNTLITIAQSGQSFSLTPRTPTLSVVGGTLTGAYPSQTLTVPTSSPTLQQVLTTGNTASTSIVMSDGISINWVDSDVNFYGTNSVGNREIYMSTNDNTGVGGQSSSSTGNFSNPTSTGANLSSNFLDDNGIITREAYVNTLCADGLSQIDLVATSVLKNGDEVATTNQLPVLTASTGITVSGTTPNYTISSTNTSSTTILTGSTNITVSGSAPNYTISTPTQTTGLIGLGALSATSPLFYNNATGVFTVQPASTSQNGVLSSTDWNTFNGKQSVPTEWTDFSVTINPQGFSSVTVTSAKYVQIGKLVICRVNYSGTSNSTTHAFTLPVAAADIEYTQFNKGTDNGIIVSAWGVTASGSTTITLFKTTAWTNSGTKGYQATFSYESQ